MEIQADATGAPGNFLKHRPGGLVACRSVVKENGAHAAQTKRVGLLKGRGRRFLETVADVEPHLDAGVGKDLLHQIYQRGPACLAVHCRSLIAEQARI